MNICKPFYTALRNISISQCSYIPEDNNLHATVGTSSGLTKISIQRTLDTTQFSEDSFSICVASETDS
jgi:hypothetical protein